MKIENIRVYTKLYSFVRCEKINNNIIKNGNFMVSFSSKFVLCHLIYSYLWYSHWFKRGDCIRYSLHSWGPRNCPSCQNEQPKTPRRYEYTIYSPLPIPHHITHRNSIQQRQGYSDNHTHGHLSLLCPLTRIEKFPRLSAVREQARDKRLLYVLD